LVPHHKEPRHRLSSPHTIIGKTGHGSPNMCEKDPSAACRPFQYAWVIGGLESNISDSNDVQILLAAKKAAQKVGIEIRITSQPKHCRSPGEPGERVTPH